VSKIKELIHDHKYSKLWQTTCGFIDLSLEEFMNTQRWLLEEQLNLLNNSELGRKVMRGASPKTLEEFRETVPLTTYADYIPELSEKREDVLPAKPVHWIHTSGKSGEYAYKWIPISERMWEEIGSVTCAIRIFTKARYKGHVNIRLNARLLNAMAPMPYISGLIAHKCEEEFGFRYLPPLKESEHLPFTERIEHGFWMAMEEGIAGVFGLAGVLVAIGERFNTKSNSLKPTALLSRPRTLLRLTRGLIKSKIAGRPMLPRDIWSLEAISCSGTDSIVYKDKINAMWGLQPLDVYACTEGIFIATQQWDRTGMTFVPNLNLLEFIPETEQLKWAEDHAYQPKTVLLDGVQAGQNYELVITNFHGGALVRYRVGDLIRITSLSNSALGINIPQMSFQRRADELIDIAGFTRLTEKVIWQAIENTGIPYLDWTARKDIYKGKSVLHIYLELKNGATATEQEFATAMHEQLITLDADYADLQNILNMKPVIITLLKNGSFLNFIAKRMAEGADLAHLKPRHINPSDEVLTVLGVKP